MPRLPVYCRSPYNYWYPPAELTPILNNQSHLILIIQGDSRKLNLDHDVSDGLHIVTPTTTNWNLPAMFVKVIDGAYYETSSLNK